MRKPMRLSGLILLPSSLVTLTLFAACGGSSTTNQSSGSTGGGGGATTTSAATTSAATTSAASTGGAAATTSSSSTGGSETTGAGGDADAGVDAGPCTEGAIGCAGHTPEKCVGGVWQLDPTCTGLTPACLDGACVACSPGTKDCGANTPRTCDATGNWQYDAPCSGATPVCYGGSCVQCSPGDVECGGPGVQSCDATGTWQTVKTCQFGCSNAQCTGICAPGAKQCNGVVPETCDMSGVWQDGPTCANTIAPLCLNGECVQCTPGSTPCNGNIPQTCDANGVAHDGVACPFTCTNGACTGMCAPNTKQCNGNVPQTCDNSGNWKGINPCPYLCTNGACTGVCIPTSKSCNGNAPQTCDSTGNWTSPGTCPQPTPDCMQGNCLCAPNHITCPATNQCVDPQTDTLNCGSCGHSCLGGACVLGVCQGVILSPALGRPTGIAVDATSVYFTNQGTHTVNKVPITGGPVQILAANQSTPQGIAVDASNVYFANNGGASNISRVDINGLSAPVIMASGQQGALSVSIDATHVYWTTTAGTVSKTPLNAVAPTAPIILASNSLQPADISTPQGLFLDSTYAYFTNGFYGLNTATIVRIPKANSATAVGEVMVRNQTRPTAVALDGTNMYWTNIVGAGSDSLSLCPKGVYCNSPTVLASLQQIAVNATNLGMIAVDGGYVYWGNGGDGKILRVPIGGGAAKVLYTGQQGVNAVVADSTYLYWNTATTVMRGVKDP